MGLLWGKCVGCEALEKQVVRLAAEKSDTQDFVLKLIEENKAIIDKLLAVTAPVALRELSRNTERAPQASFTPPRPRFPGLNPPRRPPGAHPIGAPGQAESEKALDVAIGRLNG